MMAASPSRGGSRGKVLVLGRDERSFLAVIRSLGRRGVEVHCAWCPPDAVALRSRYAAHHHDLPVATGCNGPWLVALEALCRRERFDLVLPTHDPSVVALFHQRRRLAECAHVYQLNERAFQVSFDKRATHDLAREVAVDVPDEVPVDAGTRVGDLLDRLGSPLVLKPRRSFAFGRKKWEHQVRKAVNAEEAEVALRALRDAGEVLAQAHVPGSGLGVEILAEGGEVLLAFQHERVHEPLAGGGSSYRRSVPLEDELLAAVGRLARAMDYSGVGMFEFKRDRTTGRWWLIEINGRFWGSLPLAVAAGADFPWALYRLLVHGERHFDGSYRAGLHCRNLAMDATWIWRHRRARRAGRSLATLPAATLAGELAGLCRGTERVDTWTVDDPRPGLAQARRVAGEIAWAARGKLARWPYRSALLRRGLTARLRRALPGARRLLFVCKGNVCRSPFAEHLARSLLPEELELASAGTFDEAGRRCPAEALHAARALGVDLSASRSRVLDAAAIDAAEVILVFDAADVTRVSRAFPRARRKLFRLGPLAAHGPVNLRDPYGGDLAAFHAVYAQIATALASLALIVGPPTVGT
ncbi:MAG: ATP-grasp domain-containing protein [Planctomycetota bacterium]|jgi:protein-tyrosine-phosphatase/predicted ATP-grasp superfamily ATP-dependent carboligase|nr:ATP-grasp domain-containing protein [Planctomycetota bacterium]